MKRLASPRPKPSSVGLRTSTAAVSPSVARPADTCGKRAVRPSNHLPSAANGDRAEVARRAVDILDELCRSSESETRTAARAALKRLATSSHPHAAQPAVAALRSQRIADQRRAVAAIGRLGGELGPRRHGRR